MSTKVLSILWFVGGSIFGIVLAYTLGTKTVFEPMEPVVMQPATTTETPQPVSDITTTNNDVFQVVVATSSAQVLSRDLLVKELPLNTPFSLRTVSTTDGITAEMVQEFNLTNRFRTLALTKGPADSLFSLVVAANRGEHNNDNCGSIYSGSHGCYFFLEREARYGVDNRTVYLGSLDTMGGFRTQSLRFTSTSTVEFMTGDGDAGFSIQYFWELNLNTGTISLKKEVMGEIEYDKDGKETEKITTRQ